MPPPPCVPTVTPWPTALSRDERFFSIARCLLRHSPRMKPSTPIVCVEPNRLGEYHGGGGSSGGRPFLHRRSQRDVERPHEILAMLEDFNVAVSCLFASVQSVREAMRRISDWSFEIGDLRSADDSGERIADAALHSGHHPLRLADQHPRHPLRSCRRPRR